MATPNLGYQNFFSTTLSSTITASDTTIYLNSLPTPSEGYLVIEPDSTTNREIIYYTSKGANFVTCPSVAAGRGVGGTSAASHSSGVTVQMNNNAELWTSLQDGSANTGMHQWFDESFADYIQTGGTITQATGLIASVSSGVAYINGRRLTFNAFSKTLTPARDTYVDIVAPSSTDNIATVSYTELASGVTGSTPTSNGIHLGFVNTASSSIATISQIGYDKLLNQYKPRAAVLATGIDFMPYQDKTTNSYRSGMMMQHGWSFINNDGSEASTKTITFPVAFSAPPVVLVSLAGETSGSDPTTIGDGAVMPTDTTQVTIGPHQITSSSFITAIKRTPASSGQRNLFSWLAIGPR